MRKSTRRIAPPAKEGRSYKQAKKVYATGPDAVPFRMTPTRITCWYENEAENKYGSHIDHSDFCSCRFIRESRRSQLRAICHGLRKLYNIRLTLVPPGVTCYSEYLVLGLFGNQSLDLRLV